MIGGWESFQGQNGGWHNTPIGNALPVDISSSDDRINCDQPALVVKRTDHSMIDKLPWAKHPPSIGGYNAFTAKPTGAILLETQHFSAEDAHGSITLTPQNRNPFLVIGTFNQGRTTALATDLAPHWVGGLVDWGPHRISAQAPGANVIEVGHYYAIFAQQLISWTGNF